MGGDRTIVGIKRGMFGWLCPFLGDCGGFNRSSGREDISKIGGWVGLNTFSLPARAAITRRFGLIA